MRWKETMLSRDSSSSIIPDNNMQFFNCEDGTQHSISSESSPVNAIQRRRPHGILRESSWTKRQSPASVGPSDPAAQSMRYYLWKGLLLMLIPAVGHVLSQLYPSSVLLHFTFLCFVYGLVDLVDQDPAVSYALLSSTPSISQCQERRNRRVDFAEGTKFYRMPKPMSRKQKQAFCEQRFRYPPFERNTIGKSAQLRGTVSTPFSSNTPTVDTPSPPATIDWEATNRLLKSIIEPMQQPVSQPSKNNTERDELAFQDVHGVETVMANERCPKVIVETLAEEKSSIRYKSSELQAEYSYTSEENEPPMDQSDSTVPNDQSSPSKLIGGDSAVARLRMTNAKPLQEWNRLE